MKTNGIIIIKNENIKRFANHTLLTCGYLQSFYFFYKKKKNLYYFIHNQRFNTSSNEIIDVTCSFKKKIYILHEEASSYYQSFENRMGWVS